MGDVISIILAAGRGSRMKDYEGNKTLLPLIRRGSAYEGELPMIHHIMGNLPMGPKAIVVHHKKEDLMAALKGYPVKFIVQPELNGTGGAIIAAREFLSFLDGERVIITMGDAPLIKAKTFWALIEDLFNFHMTILGFEASNKKNYGLLVTEGVLVKDIVEWKYWKDWDVSMINRYSICNAGIYSFRKHVLLELADAIKEKPHQVKKEICGREIVFYEYFLTDMVRIASDRGYRVGYRIVDENEAMGVDDPEALKMVQDIYMAGLPTLDSNA